MSSWLVAHVPAFALLVGLILVTAGLAVLVTAGVRRRFPALTGDAHNDVTRFTYGFVGFVYAFFIGFIVSAMWGEINTADANARAEGAVAVQMARDSTAFSPSDADAIRAALLAYERAAIDEWTDTDHIRSARADAALGRLQATYRDVRPGTDLEKSTLTASVANLDKLGQARTIRLLTAQDDVGPPWPLWVVIYLTSIMVLGTVIIYGVERPALHYPMVVIVSIIVATNLFLILELSHPFIGDIATSPDPLREAVWVVTNTSS
ncbi:DUF4239 domain-containing protein [Gordonia sp. OPL2]|uniref:bestrophin-like domain n=1 Tax=Gordonia sp. OPL2 TaxID=2486274 RepID=UPI0016552226|nr:DUF4239 domain-containing protein [Gordonia sp. OPL2]